LIELVNLCIIAFAKFVLTIIEGSNLTKVEKNYPCIANEAKS